MKAENMNQCREMNFYATQIDEACEELSHFIATMTGRMKLFYMKNKNNSGVSARTKNKNSQVYRSPNKSIWKKKNTTKNSHNARLSVDDEGNEASFNIYFAHDFMNLAAQTPQNISNNNFLQQILILCQSKTFTFNNSLNAQNFSYDVWNNDMKNKIKHVLSLLGLSEFLHHVFIIIGH
ncbi:hypothetical protein ACJIZ3_019808 [Penstemon smallii]|uniref:Uncharacterized protein n=1 Tax=Penstemon smallii TaxID=265156 RepID=A0ABD3T254_9LAMI